MTSIVDQTTSSLNTLVQNSVNVANRETAHTRAVKCYESEDILRALDNCISRCETIINHEVWSNFERVEDNVEQLGFDTTYASSSNSVCIVNGDTAHIGAVYLDDTSQLRVSNPHSKTHLNLEVFSRQLEKSYLKHTYNACGEPDEDLLCKETTRQRGHCLNQVGENVIVYRSVTSPTPYE
ncbi:Uncharacterized protein TCM_027447 [Theobroma cacao]|uniref:Uncharacterized protein n=1 Tax=Theobroma cacao TaxID=3641 RepID=A0A061G850_THECC|nr:Uncharacterized protein TCM_027447 [Theobroma cacao]